MFSLFWCYSLIICQSCWETLLSGTEYLRMDQVKFLEDSLEKVRSTYHFNFFKDCLSEILLGPYFVSSAAYPKVTNGACRIFLC